MTKIVQSALALVVVLQVYSCSAASLRQKRNGGDLLGNLLGNLLGDGRALDLDDILPDVLAKVKVDLLGINANLKLRIADVDNNAQLTPAQKEAEKAKIRAECKLAAADVLKQLHGSHRGGGNGGYPTVHIRHTTQSGTYGSSSGTTVGSGNQGTTYDNSGTTVGSGNQGTTYGSGTTVGSGNQGTTYASGTTVGNQGTTYASGTTVGNQGTTYASGTTVGNQGTTYASGTTVGNQGTTYASGTTVGNQGTTYASGTTVGNQGTTYAG